MSEETVRLMLESMVVEVETGPAIYRPSSFWSDLNARNHAMLDELGLSSFKRTVAQNYFNWLVVSRRDGQLHGVLKHWLRRPTLRPFLNRMERPDVLRTTIGLENHVGRSHLWIYKIFVGMLWETRRTEDWAKLAGPPLDASRRRGDVSQIRLRSAPPWRLVLVRTDSVHSRFVEHLWRKEAA